jgi:DNA excision repair protein ERCC-6
MEASSIARVAQSLKQIAQNRPATKLLDSESLPKLDAPAAPFQRLGKPLKHPVSPSSDEHEKKRPRNKTKRPLPGKKWRKANSIKESSLDGKSRVLHSFNKKSCEGAPQFFCLGYDMRDYLIHFSV